MMQIDDCLRFKSKSKINVLFLMAFNLDMKITVVYCKNNNLALPAS